MLKVSNPKLLANWYQNVLGMSIKEDGTDWICEYDIFEQSARVKLVKGNGSLYQGYRIVRRNQYHGKAPLCHESKRFRHLLVMIRR